MSDQTAAALMETREGSTVEGGREGGKEGGMISVIWSTLHSAVVNIQQSAITLRPLTGEVNNIDYLVTMAPGSGGDMY